VTIRLRLSPVRCAVEFERSRVGRTRSPAQETAVKDDNCFVEGSDLPRSTVWRHDCITREPSISQQRSESGLRPAVRSSGSYMRLGESRGRECAAADNDH
jgi:hypothetical protein